jgi:hypothetical protein
MRRGESAHGTPGRLVLTLLVMVGLVSSPLAPLGSYASAQGMRLDSGQLDLLLQALRAERAGLPRDRFDVLEALELTDFTPEGAFAWVHDETRLVPYRGALRGPVGVLLDREGNSLDRALLLQDMFDALGYDTRIVGAVRRHGRVGRPRPVAGRQRGR